MALSVDTGDWYLYNGYSTNHSFSLKFPPDWKVKTSGNNLQGFAPKEENEALLFIAKEFEGETYEQAIDSFTDENVELKSFEDIVLVTSKSDLIAKEAVYFNKEDETEFSAKFIKRGGLILALTDNGNGDYPDIIEGIYGSFKFTDDWHQYIDFKDKYTLIFPSSLDLSVTSNGLEIKDSGHFNGNIFEIMKFSGTDLLNAPGKLKTADNTLLESSEIAFHGIENVVSATYKDISANKNYSLIFIEKGGDVYSLTNTNVVSNYPHLDYYDTYLAEILESFEFFEVEGEHFSFRYFPDVRDNHQNEDAINALTEKGVINGYPDGTFRPDGEINRAELTKLIVAAQIEPSADEYKDCFPDVSDQWFAPYICYAKEQEWVEGYPNGRFRPDQSVNRVEALKIVLEALMDEIPEDAALKDETVLDIASDDWYSKYFILADNNNLLDKQHIEEEDNGYLYFPNENMLRKEVAELIYRAQKL